MIKHWLADLPTTALVITTGCVLATLTALFFFGTTITQHPIDDGHWNAWLMFVAAMLGVGYAQFAKKRDTYVPVQPPARAPHDVAGRPSLSPKSPMRLED